MNRFLTAIAAVLALLVLPSSHAADVKITAAFKPSILDPTRSSFVNTTPQSGFCVIVPSQCGPGDFSINLPLGDVSFRPLQPNAADVDSVHFRFPSDFITVPVTHQATGHTAEVKFRIVSYAGRYNIRNIAPNDHNNLWAGGSWVNGAGPCSSTGMAYFSTYQFYFRWWTPPAAATQPCVKKPTRTIPTGDFWLEGGRHSVSYALVTPNPLGMRNGVYRGKLTLVNGRGGHFDFGAQAIISEVYVNLTFELTVEHEFQLTMPDAAKRAVLEPPRGWTEWLAGGATPPRLSRDLPFVISLSAPVKLSLSCASTDGQRCRLDDGAGSRAPYSVALSMPGIVTDSGQPVSRMEITTDQPRALRPALGYAVNAKSKIHVEAGEQSVADMARRPGSRYADVFTLTFDAQIN